MTGDNFNQGRAGTPLPADSARTECAPYLKMLAHSLVFFSRQDWLPVQDAQCNGFEESDAEQSTDEQQLGAETGTTAGDVTIEGAQSSGASTGGVRTGAVTAAKGSTVAITSSDPQVTEDALAAGVIDSNNAIAGNTDVSQSALNANAAVAGTAINAVASSAEDSDAVALGSESLNAQLAQSAIASSTQQTAENDAFGEDALAAASNADAAYTSSLESESAEYAEGLSQATGNAQTTANNAATGAAQPINQQQLPTAAEQNGDGGLGTVGTWVAIIAGLLAIFYYVRKGKA